MLKRAKPPVHPGEVLKGLYLDPLEVTITQAAKDLHVARRTLSMLVNGKMGISAEMAIRLSKALDTTTPELWLSLQQKYDLWHANQKSEQLHITAIKPSAAGPHAVLRP